MFDISTRQTGFKKVSYVISALPLIASMKLEGFASDGISWESNEPASVRLGADGKACINQRPVIYTGTFSLLPNSNSRNILDMLIETATPKFGVDLYDYSIGLEVVNETTGMRTQYSGGVITSAQSGDDNNLEDGQGNKTYTITFTDKVLIPA